MSEEPQGGQAPNEEKKIIIDEDWKKRVEAERETARHAEEAPEAKAQAEGAAGPLPPADLTFLMSSLYLQGTIALGLLPTPGSDQPQANLPQARHTIDLLQMLEEKTAGNRTPEEEEELSRILHELRLAFVAVQQRAAKPQAGAAPKTGEDSAK
jgi:hypothetical protein